MVAFFFPPPAGLPSSAATVSYTYGITATTNQTNYTFVSVALGADATDRMFVVAFTTRGTGTTDPSSATMNGSSMTKAASVNLDADINLTLWYLPSGVLPTGATTTVVVNSSPTRTMCRIDVWRVVGQSSSVPYWSTTAYNAGSTSLLTFSGTPALADGASITASAAPASNPSYTWSALTEDYDTATESTDCRVSGASGVGIPATLTATTTVSLTGLMGILATWR